MMPSVAPSPAANPYMAAAAGLSVGAAGTPAPGVPGAAAKEVGVFDTAPAPKERVGRTFKFNQKGRYVALGNQMRQEAQLEQLVASARASGMIASASPSLSNDSCPVGIVCISTHAAYCI